MPPYNDVLDKLSNTQLAAIRRQNDRRYGRWPSRRVIALHEATLNRTRHPEEYVAGVRRHVASGLYRRIYPPAFVEATRIWLNRVEGRRARHGFTESPVAP